MLQRLDGSKDKISSDPDAVQLLQRHCEAIAYADERLPDAPFNTGESGLIDASRCAGTAIARLPGSTGLNPVQQHLTSDTERCFSRMRPADRDA